MGIFAKGIWGCTGFSLLRWEKGSETPSCGGGKGSETPLFPRSEHEERGSLRPFSQSQEGVSDPFSHRKRENPVHPQIPLNENPLSATHDSPQRQNVGFIWVGRSGSESEEKGFGALVLAIAAFVNKLASQEKTSPTYPSHLSGLLTIW